MKYLSTLLADARGKIAGAVAAKNRYGNYFRRWVSPTQPGSAAQQLVRNVFKYLTWQFSQDLETYQRTSWDLYAEATPLTDSLGQTYYATGQNWFVGNNAVRQQCGLLTLVDGPTTPGLPTFTPPTVSAVALASSVTLHVNPLDSVLSAATGGLHVSVSPEQSPATNFFKGPYAFTKFIPGTTSGVASAQTFSLGRVNGDVGNKLFVSVRALDPQGRVSRPFRVDGAIE